MATVSFLAQLNYSVMLSKVFKKGSVMHCKIVQKDLDLESSINLGIKEKVRITQVSLELFIFV